jgi:hypothetical protein
LSWIRLDTLCLATHEEILFDQELHKGAFGSIGQLL